MSLTLASAVRLITNRDSDLSNWLLNEFDSRSERVEHHQHNLRCGDARRSPSHSCASLETLPGRATAPLHLGASSRWMEEEEEEGEEGATLREAGYSAPPSRRPVVAAALWVKCSHSNLCDAHSTIRQSGVETRVSRPGESDRKYILLCVHKTRA
ncbi:hypothetical protein E2C01_031089 [Portunus trituberculatus]|uniref:Uncharacterized protein n=1 Tax=Portunus trituberculatus TaxID=210409 RepID=A0A5B7ETJ3_PORTR|nr:hypothetical protein [Portunus trituberculatus]